jgi:hypothetical protein
MNESLQHPIEATQSPCRLSQYVFPETPGQLIHHAVQKNKKKFI